MAGKVGEKKQVRLLVEAGEPFAQEQRGFARISRRRRNWSGAQELTRPNCASGSA